MSKNGKRLDESSNYMYDVDHWNNHVFQNEEVVEVECKRCYGTGEDRDGADCIYCDGYGTLEE